MDPFCSDGLTRCKNLDGKGKSKCCDERQKCVQKYDKSSPPKYLGNFCEPIKDPKDDDSDGNNQR